MDNFLTQNFLLNSELAEQLYHDCARSLPIIDYHCHLPPKDIAEDRQFDNITNIWLDGDHYKWRAMRTLGVDEEYITGSASDLEKFNKWAQTVPYTLRNPLYHWTHLELKRYFDVDELLNEENAEAIYHRTTEQLQTEAFSARNLLRSMNVELVCTSDDPADSLEYHQQIRDDDFEIEIRPTFRPDQAYHFEDPDEYGSYLDHLEEVTGSNISSFSDLLQVLENRIDYFEENGCMLSDHGLEKISYEPASEAYCNKAFDQIRSGQSLSPDQAESLRYHMLIELGEMYHERGWVQQFHLGALRNTNQRMHRKIGADTGFDSIGDFSQAENLAAFLDTLDKYDQLPQTILYNVNPKDNATMATMAGNYNDGSIKGKMQYGPAWWFLDQQDGIEDQLNTLSNMGLLSCFIGMLTDSRSFLSYPRHEYFRRILCNLFAEDVNSGKLPEDIELIERTISDICYHNAIEYFNLKLEPKVL